MNKWIHRSRKELDTSRWNAVVANSSNEIIYGYSWYLDSVCPDWIPLIYGDYEAIFPLPVRSKLGVKYAFQPLFLQRTACYGQSVPLEDIAVIIDALVTKVDLTSEQVLYDESKELQNLILVSKSQLKLNTNSKRAVKKAQNLNLKIAELGVDKTEEVLSVFKDSTRFQLDKGFDESFIRLAQNLSDHKALKIFSAGNSEPSAYAVFAVSKTRVSLLMLSVSEKGRNSGSAHFLINETASRFLEEGLIFDFEGSQDEGISRFYKSFGAKSESYFYINRSLSTTLTNRILKKH